MTYSEKLKDPRWQKKRLEVMEAADFKCQMCGDAEETLHVHHVNYRKGAKPWDYQLQGFKCLCEECHKTVEINIQLARQLICDIKPDLMQEIIFALHEAQSETAANDEIQRVDNLLGRALAYAKASIICDKIGTGSRRAIAAYLYGDLYCVRSNEESDLIPVPPNDK